MSTRSTWQTSTVLAIATSVAACESDDTLPRPSLVGVPHSVHASTNDPERVHVTWSAPWDGAVSEYLIFREGTELARGPGSITSYDDRTVLPATLAPPLDVIASNGTSEEAVTVTWKPSTADGKVSGHAYAVAALRGSSRSGPSAPATGSRSGELTAYEVSVDEGATWRTVGLQLEYADTA